MASLRALSGVPERFAALTATAALAAVLFAPLSCRQADVDRDTAVPARLVFVVGDGMGLSQITAGMYAAGGSTVFERFPVVGLIKTHSARERITDSAAGATAFATGTRTRNGAISVDTAGRPLRTLFEEGAELGYRTGLAVSCQVTHATPACYYAHDTLRTNYEAIAGDFAVATVDYAAGWGRQYFDARSDGVDLVARLEEGGVKVCGSLDEAGEAEPGRLAVLLPDPPPAAYERPGDWLSRAAGLGWDRLAAEGAPFLMLVEGAQIDWAGHANHTGWLLDEQLDFEHTLEDLLDRAEADGGTLVVVTADHETGGFSLTGEDLSDSAGTAWSTGYHTSTMVPVFAFGPGAEHFAGVYDNTGIHVRIRQALGWR